MLGQRWRGDAQVRAVWAALGPLFWESSICAPREFARGLPERLLTSRAPDRALTPCPSHARQVDDGTGGDGALDAELLELCEWRAYQVDDRPGTHSWTGARLLAPGGWTWARVGGRLGAGGARVGTPGRGRDGLAELRSGAGEPRGGRRAES